MQRCLEQISQIPGPGVLSSKQTQNCCVLVSGLTQNQAQCAYSMHTNLCPGSHKLLALSGAVLLDAVCWETERHPAEAHIHTILVRGMGDW